MISHAHLPFTLPCLRPCLPPVPNLWLLLLLFQIAWTWFHYGYERRNNAYDGRGNWLANFSFDYTFIIREKSRKMKVSQSLLEESGKRPHGPGLGERDSSKFSALLWSRKDSSCRKCSVALFIVASMSAWFDNRCLSPSVAQLFEGWLALNPGFYFFFFSRAFSRIIFSVIFKSIQSSTCWQKG